MKAYRKVHLFNVSVHNGPILMEGRGTAPGQKVRAGQCALRPRQHPHLLTDSFMVHGGV